ncbi:flagellar basal body L-ring protein [Psychromonas sp. CNPT3]|uniref:flagellar basal body L-ring protein FlgH n=1 Tax=Psychromonas sp. CNPT3 TaxID=314282 RepID=UPI00006E5676|nr:flagellar basal body L-ring protein FlgH [Psychromonas sp. CNPT3]AGH80843.1 flagellar basal body L-ring protein [Psychromonas sp. CNPT3]
MIKKLVIAISIVLMWGCTSLMDPINAVGKKVQQKEDKSQRQVTSSTEDHSPTADDPYYAPIDPSRNAEAILVTGSLFNSETAHDLYNYETTFQLGDSITVLLKEKAVATKSATSTLASATNYKLDPIQVPGGPMTVNGKVVELGMKQGQDFDGAADSAQSHSLTARITVSIVEILNNGNLKVRGEKWLVINNGKEYIRFTGIVRPSDITEKNSVESYQVANSRIEFSGTGDHADIQTQGWLSSFFSSSLWPI